MARIVFEGHVPERTKTAEVAGAGALVDVADDVLAPVPFSCRSASCGTCLCHVLEGAELLEAPEADEAELLELMAAGADARLCCQARFRAGPGTIRVKAAQATLFYPADDDE